MKTEFEIAKEKLKGCGSYIRQSWGEDLFCGDLNEYGEEYCKECYTELHYYLTENQ